MAVAASGPNTEILQFDVISDWVMSSYQHKSGAQKRQEMQPHVNEEKRGSRTLSEAILFAFCTFSTSLFVERNIQTYFRWINS